MPNGPLEDVGCLPSDGVHLDGGVVARVDQYSCGYILVVFVC